MFNTSETSIINRKIAKIMSALEVAGITNQALKDTVKKELWHMHDDLIDMKASKGDSKDHERTTNE